MSQPSPWRSYPRPASGSPSRPAACAIRPGETCSPRRQDPFGSSRRGPKGHQDLGGICGGLEFTQGFHEDIPGALGVREQNVIPVEKPGVFFNGHSGPMDEHVAVNE